MLRVFTMCLFLGASDKKIHGFHLSVGQLSIETPRSVYRDVLQKKKLHTHAPDYIYSLYPYDNNMHPIINNNHDYVFFSFFLFFNVSGA